MGENIHVALAVAAAIGALAVAAVGVLGIIRPPLNRFWLDRLLLVAEAAIVLAIASGGVLFVAGERPGDLLHLLYGVLALMALPVARAWGGPRAGRRPGVMLLGAAVLLGVLLRLWQTGGT
jgi:hypothetical protein